MGQDLDFFDRLPPGEENKCYAYLLQRARGVLERNRHRWFRDELSRSTGPAEKRRRRRRKKKRERRRQEKRRPSQKLWEWQRQRRGQEGKRQKRSGSHHRDQSRDRSHSRGTTKDECDIYKNALGRKMQTASKGSHLKSQSPLPVFRPRSRHQWKGLRISAPPASGSGE